MYDQVGLEGSTQCLTCTAASSKSVHYVCFSVVHLIVYTPKIVDVSFYQLLSKIH